MIWVRTLASCGRVRAHGEEVEPEPEDEDQHDPRNELGDDREREPADRDDTVDGAGRVERRDDAAEDRERHDEDEGEHGELERVAERGPDSSLTGTP